MADIPREIQVGPLACKVIVSAKAIAEAQKEAGSTGVYGRFYWRTLEIHIDPDVTPHHQRDALLHETRHAIWHLLRMDDDRKYLEEDVISRETPMLVDVLRRNPQLVAFLLDGAAP